MNYYLDQEFIEGFRKPFLGRQRHFIDLISIGIVAEDGREYYAVTHEFDLRQAWNRYDLKLTGKLDLPGIHRSTEKIYWLRENVLRPIWKDLCKQYLSDTEITANNHQYTRMAFQAFTYNSLQGLLSIYGKPLTTIAKEVKEFCIKPGLAINLDAVREAADKNSMTTQEVLDLYYEKKIALFDISLCVPLANRIEFYGYYSDYDWVLFCSLFGKMIDLPKGFPMYCRDLKQTLDEKLDTAMILFSKRRELDIMGTTEHQLTLHEKLEKVKAYHGYPKQENEHNALADARWNKKLHEFIKWI